MLSKNHWRQQVYLQEVGNLDYWFTFMQFHENWTNSWWFLNDRTEERLFGTPPLISTWLIHMVPAKFIETELMQQVMNRERHSSHAIENDN